MNEPHVTDFYSEDHWQSVMVWAEFDLMTMPPFVRMVFAKDLPWN